MSRSIALPDEIFERLASHARSQGRSTEDLACAWISERLPPLPQTDLFGHSRSVVPPPPNSPAEGVWMLWADGACSGNPGPGGWGIVVKSPDGSTEEYSQGYLNTTNNRMEMRGAIAAIESIPKGGKAVMHTDSRYVVDAIEKKWVDGWKKRGWRKADGGEVKNVDLWQRMTAAMQGRSIRFQWVEGHAGNAMNERCDKLAVGAAKSGAKIPDDQD